MKSLLFILLPTIALAQDKSWYFNPFASPQSTPQIYQPTQSQSQYIVYLPNGGYVIYRVSGNQVYEVYRSK